MDDGGSHAHRFTPGQRRVTLIAVIITFLLSALDQTVVSTAMPRIVAELKGLQFYGWVTTGYLVASTIMIPIWGKLSDLYGRRPVLIAGVAVFTAGSVLCGLAGVFGGLFGGGMMQLILFRGLQGLGGGALFTSAFSVISDLYPARERGRLGGIFGGVFALASVLGPIIGGALSDLGAVHLFGAPVSGWRWVFYVNLPFALAGLAILIFLTPELNKKVRGHVDWLGVTLLVAGLLPLLIGLSLGGQAGGWSTPLVIGLLAAGVCALGLFFVAEWRSKDPLLSLELFENRVFLFTNITGLLTSMAFIGVITFLPLYLQLGQGLPPTQSGIALIPLILCLILSAAGSGLLATQTGRYKALVVGGAVFTVAGSAGLWLIRADMTGWDVAWRGGALGLGIGPMQSLLSLAVQNAVAPSKIGIATGVSQFFREAGSTLGVAALGTVMNATLAGGATLADLQKLAIAAQAGGKAGGLDMGSRLALTHAVQEVMLAALAISVLGVLAAVLIPSVKLKAGSTGLG